MADLLLLGSGAKLLQPDALDNHVGSEDANVTPVVRGKRIAPLGPDGEVVFRRIVLTGYHRSSFAFYLTPVLNGTEQTPLLTYVSRPAPASGQETRFSIIIPLYRDSLVMSNVRTGLVGATIEALIELVAPAARFDFENCDFLHEPIDDTRNKSVTE